MYIEFFPLTLFKNYSLLPTPYGCISYLLFDSVGGMGILPVIFGRTFSTQALKRKIRANPSLRHPTQLATEESPINLQLLQW
ncbi:MAG: hypothetical protein F6K26_21795 [Moorea sp. SIO2I5]|nr:hypothetical protein [Moorena sp. SIO2I5]